MKSHFDVCKVITESFTKVQEISEGNCDALSFPKKTDQLVESKKKTRVKGQSILKRLFAILEFFQKTNETIQS